MTWEALKSYVGSSDVDDAFVEECWDEATALVASYTGTTDVPSSVLSRAIKECGSELYHRRSAPNGIAQFATMDGGAATRVARDPMVGAYPILRPYVGLGIA